MTAESEPTTERQVTIPHGSLDPFRRLSLYNSPYPAHDAGCAIDLYPDSNDGISPVSGEVRATRTVRTPQQSYAVEHDHLILVDCDAEWCAAAGLETDVVARVLHVDPGVEPGDCVAVGDSLGEMVRSGFFAPWVDNHVHLGFRTRSQNLQRASGSLPLSLPFAPTPLAWDGAGTVVETGETYVVLDTPTHPGRTQGWCGIGASTGVEDEHAGVIDGGLPHYDKGGLLGVASAENSANTGPVSLLGSVVGDRTGRTVTWRDVGVEVSGERAHGLSLFVACDGPAGAKVVCLDHAFEPGEQVQVRIV
jgi:hypothetical protein